jgi:hypothetical protein
MLPWDQLISDLKESNRQQAIDIPTKLRVINHSLAPKTHSQGSPFLFSSPEIDLLAEQEHIRFVKERTKAGWRYGLKRDPVIKTSLYLVPWDELDDEAKDIDRSSIRAISEIVDKAGLQIIAMPKEKGC